ncbi:MAG: phosphate/phosphite/phosphonate ABC transporter substrate-binding protein [Pseudomonadota bacterium]
MRRVHPAAESISRWLVGWLLLLFTFATFPVFAADQPEELLIGIEPEHNIFDQMERYHFLADYLSEQLGVKINLTIMSRYGEVINRFKALRLDGAFLTSYTATMAIKELHLVPLVNPVHLNGESTSQGYIFVRKDSGIRGIKDMLGKSIVFVDPATMEGFLFPLAYLKQHGIMGIKEFSNRVYFSGSHASTIFAVLDGRADIGAAKSTVFRKLVLNDPSIQQELQIIAESPKVPEVTLCIKEEIAAGLRSKLETVLLNMGKTPEGQDVLKQFEALRFIKAGKADFAIIDEMARDALTGMTEHGKD